MMERAGDSDKIRLPELPVFKRFSLALRQEYATAEEILAVIDRTVSRIKDVIDRDEEIRRRAREQEIEEQRAAYADELIEEVEEDSERLDELVPREEPVELPVAIDEEVPRDELTTDEEIAQLLTSPEPSIDTIFPLEDQEVDREVDSLIPEEDELATLIRPETEEIGTPSVAQARSAAKAEAPASIEAPPAPEPEPEQEPEPKPAKQEPKVEAKPKPAAKKKTAKRKTAQPEIVRVSKDGKPLGLSKVRKQNNEPAATKRAPTAKSKKTSRGKRGKSR